MAGTVLFGSSPQRSHRSAADDAQRAPGAAPDCVRPANRIVAENCKPGNPSTEWDVNGSGDLKIQGFATDISVNVGETISFKIESSSPAYRIDIYRLGYYGGMGARQVASIRPSVAAAADRSPHACADDAVRLYDCGNWAVSASWAVPRDAVSGIYIARLVREDNEPASWAPDNSRTTAARPAPLPHAYGALGLGKLANALKEPRASHIYFIVRDDESRADLSVPDDGHHLAGVQPRRHHEHVWQLRPGPSDGARLQGQHEPAVRARATIAPSTMVFNAEYPMVRWLEANGYDVTYSTGVDSDRRGALIRNHKVFLSVGHDEYWSGAQRANVEAARDAGVHLAFFSGNDVFWKIRWEPSTDPSHTPYRTLVTYKETHANAKIDPLPDVWTGTWRDSRPFNPEGPKPENALKGTIFTVNAWRNDPLIVPARFAELRFWRNTEVAQLKPGQQAVLGYGILGHEWNEDLDNGFRPAGLDADVGDDRQQRAVHPGLRHGLRGRHRDPSSDAVSRAERRAGLQRGHRAVGVGARRRTTIPRPGFRRSAPTAATSAIGVDLKGPVRAIQQATMNLFADMGVQPATRQAGPGARDARRPTARRRPRASIPARRDRSRTAPSKSPAPHRTPGRRRRRRRSVGGRRHGPGIRPRARRGGATGSRPRPRRPPARSSAARSTTAGISRPIILGRGRSSDRPSGPLRAPGSTSSP